MGNPRRVKGNVSVSQWEMRLSAHPDVPNTNVRQLPLRDALRERVMAGVGGGGRKAILTKSRVLIAIRCYRIINPSTV